MTLRNYLQCSICEKITLLRIQIGYREVEEIDFECKECHNPIHCELHLDQENIKILGLKKMTGADQIFPNDERFDFVVNHSADFAQHISYAEDPYMSPFIAAFKRGGASADFLERTHREVTFDKQISEEGDVIKRLIRNYETGNWKHFGKTVEPFLLQ